MEKVFRVKNLEFKEEDQILLNVTDLKAGSLLPGFLCCFLPSKPEKPLVLKNPGSYLTEDFIQKMENKNVTNLSLFQAIDENKKNEIVQLLRKIEESKFEEEKIKSSEELMSNIYREAFSKSGKGSFLNYIIAFYEVFYALDNSSSDIILSHDQDQFIYLSEVAFFSVFLCLVMGYYDFRWLCDFYNLSFLVDLKLYEKFSFSLNNAIKLENETCGQGKVFLTRLKLGTEVKLFNEHPKMAYDLAVSQKDRFYFEKSAEALLYHHEWGDGKGFPNALRQDQLFDWKAILAFSDRFIEKKDFFFFREDIKGYYGERMKSIANKKSLRRTSFMRIIDRVMKYNEFFNQVKSKETAA